MAAREVAEFGDVFDNLFGNIRCVMICQCYLGECFRELRGRSIDPAR